MSFMSAIMGKSASEQAAMPQAAQPAQPAQQPNRKLLSR
jgi:hypothetical protein